MSSGSIKNVINKMCFIGLGGRVSAHGPGDRGSIPGQVIPKIGTLYLLP